MREMVTTGRFGDVISGMDRTSVSDWTSAGSVGIVLDFLGMTRNGELSLWRRGDELDSETMGEFSTNSGLDPVSGAGSGWDKSWLSALWTDTSTDRDPPTSETERAFISITSSSIESRNSWQPEPKNKGN